MYQPLCFIHTCFVSKKYIIEVEVQPHKNLSSKIFVVSSRRESETTINK